MDKIENTLQAGTLLQGNYSYRILSVLGQGSFGITYKAEIRVVGPLGELPGEKTKVAIKEYFLRECNSRENPVSSKNRRITVWSRDIGKIHNGGSQSIEDEKVPGYRERGGGFLRE